MNTFLSRMALAKKKLVEQVGSSDAFEETSRT